ncbi:MAG: methylenetetrahydrofolate reductase [Methylomonas sp.]|nr:methylenetetrahydrofolate reductase [Methylomonas sp.]PPD22797.1 MAG: methylenetetrahydrofolate reductase [Methylomonas sp.]PPD25286.1 MAG: methylenetetrahydrofolate reductase [Methylomonas sp.]PPD35275.1 MAG: methylenetetrahydrofolate reductase [Methylomonas sp.]PPD42765.1 MAG: methylenetetrahydrofolate reductase [Methylomonas sp.]
MNISFEIVPRSLDAFDQQYAFAESLGTDITVINVPDIQHFDTRSWQLASRVDRSRYRFIPHFRAIDFKIESGELFRIIETHQLDSVLLVSGDPPEGLKRAYYNTDVVDLIRAVRQRFPSLHIYAGFDPHRSGIQDECDYIQRKADAGAQGFFSQPFYDSRMIEIYSEQMNGLETYVGISPITTQASMNYWEVKNKVKFPKGFSPDYDWNVAFANHVIQTAMQQGLNVYFMPIRIDLERYFKALHTFAG